MINGNVSIQEGSAPKSTDNSSVHPLKSVTVIFTIPPRKFSIDVTLLNGLTEISPTSEVNVYGWFPPITSISTPASLA